MMLAPNTANDVVPDVRGYGLRDVLFRLEKLGLKVKVRGVGCVTQQSLQPGYRFKRGEEIELILGDAKDIPVAEQDSLHNDGAAQKAQANQQPEDPELTPTLSDEKKYKEKEKQAQEDLKQQRAQKAEKNLADQKKKEEEQKQKKKSKQPAIEPKQKKESNKQKDKKDEDRKNSSVKSSRDAQRKSADDRKKKPAAHSKKANESKTDRNAKKKN